MHVLNINGEPVKVYHHRTWHQIFERPHVYRSRHGWNVAYLVGSQTRIRTNVFYTLDAALIQVRHLYHYNRLPQVAAARAKLVDRLKEGS